MIIEVSKVVNKENVDGSRTKVTGYIQRKPKYNYQLTFRRSIIGHKGTG